MQANPNKVNKTWGLLQTTVGKDEPNIYCDFILSMILYNYILLMRSIRNYGLLRPRSIYICIFIGSTKGCIDRYMPNQTDDRHFIPLTGQYKFFMLKCWHKPFYYQDVQTMSCVLFLFSCVLCVFSLQHVSYVVVFILLCCLYLFNYYGVSCNVYSCRLIYSNYEWKL
jgi:hypothetical protein